MRSVEEGENKNGESKTHQLHFRWSISMLHSISLDLLSYLPSPTWFLDPPSQSPRPQLLPYLLPHRHHLPPALIRASLIIAGALCLRPQPQSTSELSKSHSCGTQAWLQPSSESTNSWPPLPSGWNPSFSQHSGSPRWAPLASPTFSPTMTSPIT